MSRRRRRSVPGSCDARRARVLTAVSPPCATRPRKGAKAASSFSAKSLQRRPIASGNFLLARMGVPILRRLRAPARRGRAKNRALQAGSATRRSRTARRASPPRSPNPSEKSGWDNSAAQSAQIAAQSASRTSRASEAGARGGKRRAAGIVDLDVPAQQFGAHPLRQAAIRRRPARRSVPSCSNASRRHHGDGQRLLAFVRASIKVTPASAAARFRRLLRRARAARGRWCRLGEKPRKRIFRARAPSVARADRAERDHLLARHAEVSISRARKACGWVAQGSSPLRIGGEGSLVKALIEPWQHHGALRRAGDGREQARGDDIRAGRAEGDRPDSASRATLVDGAGDQHLLARRRIDKASLVLNLRPGCDGDVEKPQRDPPIIVEFAAEVLQARANRHFR